MSEIEMVLPSVYLLYVKLSKENKKCLRSYSGKLVEELESRLARLEDTPNAVQRGEGRWQIDFKDLLSLRREESRARHCPLVYENMDEAKGCLEAIHYLLGEFRNALKQLRVKDSEEMFYYAYCIYARPNSPAQEMHKDLGFKWGKGYFTALLALSNEAENTEFLHEGRVVPVPGFICFDGHVMHRGPAVGDKARIVLALVASPKPDENSISNSPFMNCAKDWGIIVIK